MDMDVGDADDDELPLTVTVPNDVPDCNGYYQPYFDCYYSTFKLGNSESHLEMSISWIGRPRLDSSSSPMAGCMAVFGSACDCPPTEELCPYNVVTISRY
jgi:hypothetical protein